MAEPLESSRMMAKLTKGMEHMRPYVSVPSSHSPSPSPAPQHQPLPPPQSLSSSIPATTADADIEQSVYGVPSSAINPIRRPTQRDPSHPNPQKRTDPFQFGSRFLEEGDDIFEYNAWDHVEVDDAFKEFAELQYQRQRETPVSEFDKKRFNDAPEKWWNRFYGNNASNFFKDRKWLFQEFPVLAAATSAASPAVTLLELGAGAGNTAFPILAANQNPDLRLHACDFSKKAVGLIRTNPLYDERHLQADVWDVAATSDEGGVSLPPGLAEGSVDVVIMIFIFSALEPRQWTQALRNVYAVLKPGGQILFRDYGRGDLAQVRFKTGRWLEDNFYVRGDGTRVYFFEREELESLFGRGQELSERDDMDVQVGELDAKEAVSAAAGRPRFEVLNIGADRRMLVNRKRKLKMYRCWMQGHFRKPAAPGS